MRNGYDESKEKDNEQMITKANQSEDDLELFKKYQTTKTLDENGKLLKADTRLRNDLAQRNAKLVTFVINKFYSKKQRHKELRSDLLQEGHLGLFDAIDGFKPELGFKFSTYATWWIRQSVNSYLLDEEPMLHIPSHIRTARNKLFNLAKMRSIAFKDISKDMLAELNITEKMHASVVAAVKTKSWNVQSIDEPLSSSMDKTLRDVIPGNEIELSSCVDNKRILEAARQAFQKLNLREKCVLLERYGIECDRIVEKELGK
jgi:RNA polymerase nonessential primary-like sigma factor